MTFAGLHAVARRQRRRLALLGVMLFLAGSLVVAHSGAIDGHLDEGMAMCLAVAATGAAVLLGRARATAHALRGTAVSRPTPCRVGVAPVAVLPRTRDGPAVLQVFLR